MGCHSPMLGWSSACGRVPEPPRLWFLPTMGALPGWGAQQTSREICGRSISPKRLSTYYQPRSLETCIWEHFAKCFSCRAAVRDAGAKQYGQQPRSRDWAISAAARREESLAAGAARSGSDVFLPALDMFLLADSELLIGNLLSTMSMAAANIRWGSAVRGGGAVSLCRVSSGVLMRGVAGLAVTGLSPSCRADPL